MPLGNGHPERRSVCARGKLGEELSVSKLERGCFETKVDVEVPALDRFSANRTDGEDAGSVALSRRFLGSVGT